jgi:hypothetical protein
LVFSCSYFYNISPEGRKFRSRTELRQYLEKHSLDHNPEEFDFSIWGRGNRPGKNMQGQEGKKKIIEF